MIIISSECSLLKLVFSPQIVEDDDGQGVMRIELQREKKGN